MNILSTVKIPEELHKLTSLVPSLSVFDAVVAGIAIWAFLKLMRMSHRRVRTTELGGPPSPSYVYGVGKILLEAEDPASIYESWADEYGSAYQVPATLGKRRVILYDSKAIAHFHTKQTWTYVRTPAVKLALEHGFGRGIFWADGESHARQRKSLTPAFSVAAIRHLTPIFYDSAHKAKAAWGALIESSGGDSAVVDVQNWMNHVSLDVIGRAGFSHDFGALDGKHAAVTEIFDSFTSSSSSLAIDIVVNILADAIPSLMRIPTTQQRLVQKLNDAVEEISNVLLARTKQEMDAGIVSGKEEKSVIGLLSTSPASRAWFKSLNNMVETVKGQSSESEYHLTREEVLAQMKVLFLAGYETAAISVTWALIELSRNPDMQTKLRNELLEHGAADPTYDQLSNGLPYLDAIVHETLRIHAPVRETTRIANEDDVIPLSEPTRTKSGQLVESLSIAKGTIVSIPQASVNLSATFWGKDAKVFNPSRWLEDSNDGIPTKAKEVQGHRHLLTFSDGPRVCLGKNFAVTEFKAVLAVLVKNFVFELHDGTETKIEIGRGFLPRPRVAGETGCKTPLRVTPYTG